MSRVLLSASLCRKSCHVIAPKKIEFCTGWHNVICVILFYFVQIHKFSSSKQFPFFTTLLIFSVVFFCMHTVYSKRRISDLRFTYSSIDLFRMNPASFFCNRLPPYAEQMSEALFAVFLKFDNAIMEVSTTTYLRKTVRCQHKIKV